MQKQCGACYRGDPWGLTDAATGVVETTAVDRQPAMLTFPFGHQLELSLLQQIIHPAQPCWRSVTVAHINLAELDCQDSSWQSISNPDLAS